MTQSPYGVMSPPRQCQTLHLESSFKPLHLTWGMSCHQNSSMMKEHKKTSNGKCQRRVQSESSSSVPSVLFTPCVNLSVSAWT